MHLRQLDSSRIAFEGGEQYLIILSQNCIQIEMDSVEKFKFVNIFLKKRIGYTDHRFRIRIYIR